MKKHNCYWLSRLYQLCTRESFFHVATGIAFFALEDLMKVEKVINNNIVRSLDDHNNEVLVIGCLCLVTPPGGASIW